MIPQTTAIQRLRNSHAIVGTMVRMVRSSALAPLAREAGLDFIMLDMEHGPFSFPDVSEIATACRAEGITILVRVPELSRGSVSRALDCGVQGIMVPMLETAAQARQLVAWAKYPPLGGRGLGSMGGNTGFARLGSIPQFLQDSNEATITIAQIETVLGVQNAGEIARVDGLDALLVGPHDLAVSLGKPGQLTCPEENDAIGRIAAAAKEAGKVFGMHCGPELLQRWAGHGMRLFMNGLDLSVLGSGFAALARETRRISDEARA